MKSFCETYKNYFLIGAAVNPITIEAHKDLIIKHFNSLTAENHMKFIKTHPEENKFTFEEADKIVALAVENNKKIRGHTLVWHNQTPEWVLQAKSGDTVKREVLLERMKSHISGVVNHFKGKVYCWAVVNEAVKDEGNELFRETKWKEIIGEDYIKKAFQYAHETDPDALLFYNDYYAVKPEKRDKIIKLLKRLKANGTPIHGFGIQAHWNIHDFSLDEIKKSIELYASLDLNLQITELDVSVFGSDDKRKDLKQPTEEMVASRDKFYRNIFSIFREYKDVITNVTFWGVADDFTWLNNFPVKGRKDWPLLFNDNHEPKKALMDVMNI